ncbi:MAG TPA: hypothetical protein VL087_00960 [Nitrospirota bacterium]|nr:hypothetical protein [Nitrospirota bacterium]
MAMEPKMDLDQDLREHLNKYIDQVTIWSSEFSCKPREAGKR